MVEIWDENTTDDEGAIEPYIEYRADSENPYPGEWPPDEARGNPDAPKWRASIHMPRWASRITLRVTDVRIERVQDTSEDDARAEGVTLNPSPVHRISCYRLAFNLLWDSIYAERGDSWLSNPWVWVIEFERVEAEQ